MSQVQSRPVSQMKVGVSLPEIKHPFSRLDNPDSMDVRGVSRSGGARLSFNQPLTGRPLANEGMLNVRRSFSAADRDGLFVYRKHTNMLQPVHMGNIPEGVEVRYGDSTTTRLPVFGTRTGQGEGDTQSRDSSRDPHQLGQERLELEEIEAHLRRKLKHNFHDVRKKFKDNDPEGKGNVSRDALARILVTLAGRPISGATCRRLLERLGFTKRQTIAFRDFVYYFRDCTDATLPQWVDAVSRPNQAQASLTSDQVHASLGEKNVQRYHPDHELAPNQEPLTGAPNTEQGKESAETVGRKSSLPNKAEPNHTGTRLIRKKELERSHQMSVETWLKNKFREGFFSMKDAFEERDPGMKGLVNVEDFLHVLSQFGLTLEKNLLAAFLNRCSVKVIEKHIPYRDFLYRFQDREEDIVTEALPQETNRNRRGYMDPNKDAALVDLEVQLTSMFQRDYLALLGTFKQIDHLGADAISQEEFRAAIESKFNLELTDYQFESFIDHVPLDSEGSVKYATFMQQFDGRGQAPSLFGDVRKTHPSDPHSKLDRVGGDSAKIDGRVSPLMPPAVFIDMEDGESSKHRSKEELFKIIKDLMIRNFPEMEQKFYDLDETNTRRLTPETMYYLLKSFDIRPVISRGEIRDLWTTFITNSDKTLDYLQFVRHFRFSMRSATFPNAKMSPPRRGDADCMVRSNRLNCANDILQDSFRAKVEYLWEDLRREFASSDPRSTGCVSKDDFVEVLSRLGFSLNNTELEHLTEKFETKAAGRVSYVEFLKPFAVRKQTWQGDNMLGVLQQTQINSLAASDNTVPPPAGLQGITAKLRQNLSGEWTNLRRAFKKLDIAGSGYLSVPEFRAVLKMADVVLNEEEVYHVMNEFDPNLAGQISYERFMGETFKSERRNSFRSK